MTAVQTINRLFKLRTLTVAQKAEAYQAVSMVFLADFGYGIVFWYETARQTLTGVTWLFFMFVPLID